MAHLSATAATLRFFGDDLEPEELNHLLGKNPTKSHRKGAVIVGKVTGKKRIAKTGSWLFQATSQEPGDLDAQVLEILSALSKNIETWKELTSRYEADINCGLFMDDGNEGIGLSKETL